MANKDLPLPCPTCMTEAKPVHETPDWASGGNKWWRIVCGDPTCGTSGRWHFQENVAVQSWNLLSGRGRLKQNSATLDSVIHLLRRREKVGLDHYKCTVDRTDVDPEFWVRMAVEESLDLAVYLTRLLRDIDKVVDNTEQVP